MSDEELLLGVDKTRFEDAPRQTPDSRSPQQLFSSVRRFAFAVPCEYSNRVY